MSYLAPHFDPDVFVSYSQGDAIGGHAPLRDWTQALVGRLRDRLHALETEFDELNIWMDLRVDPTTQLTEDLKAKASSCGILMIVMTKRFLQSSWCRDELEWFKEQIQERTIVGGRLFVIRAQQTDTNLWPDFLRDERGHALTGFSFYDPEYGYPWGFQLREPGDDYFRELTRLQIWLTRRLRELRKRADKSAKFADTTLTAAPQPAGPRLVYLHARPESESVRTEIGLVLRSDGFIPIAPTASAGTTLADWRREAKDRMEAAKRCEALALLRVVEGERFVGDLLEIGVDERERIAGARGAPLPCAVLDKTGKALPIDVTPFGIERFDVNRTDWRGQFRAWLDAVRGPLVRNSP
jgi:hypothetical protein